MKRNIFSFILCIILICSLVACGNKKIENVDSDIEESKSIAIDSDEKVDSEVKNDISKENTEVETENEYIEKEDIFQIKKIDTGNGIQVVDFSEMELFSTHYVIPESIDIYSYFGTYAGYTKPGIEIKSGRRNDEWTSICFAETSFLVKTEEFDKVAQVVEEIESESTEINVDNSNNQDFIITPGTPEMNVETNHPIQNDTQETSSNKYTAEDAIADYRSIMEANGISFDPSIKEYASWGTGMLPLNKEEVEYFANSSVESFAMGDSVGNSWTKYYLEVTGSDESYVYFTGYHSN